MPMNINGRAPRTIKGPAAGHCSSIRSFCRREVLGHAYEYVSMAPSIILLYTAHTPPPAPCCPATSPPVAWHPPSPATPPSRRNPHQSESSADNKPSQTCPPYSPPACPSSSDQHSSESPAR